ncbi:hypothetical protein [Actinomadura geliboluensis]|uniref:hypothetical protein n=1 Tax=Actinomadura geliboluensis TaxID=882440 RepID=UPI0036C56889
MKIRLMDLPEEIDAWVEALRSAFDVVEVSRPIPNRGDSRQVRVYVEIRLPEDGPAQAVPASHDGDRAAQQLRRVHNVLGWARTRITALHNKRDKTPETQRAHRRECDARAEEVQRLADELDKALNEGEPR